MPDRDNVLSRRRFLRRAAVAGGTLAAGRAFAAEDPFLQSLIKDNQSAEFGQGFDSASRTILMPKSSLPTLSASTAQATEQAIGKYEAIVARGGWPQVAPTERLRLGNRHRSVTALREQLMVAGDLAP